MGATNVTPFLTFMTYEKAFEILEWNLVSLWSSRNVEDLLKFMRENGDIKSSVHPWAQAYAFMTASKKREDVVRVWVAMKMLPSGKR